MRTTDAQPSKEAVRATQCGGDDEYPTKSILRLAPLNLE
jgi:hypothetical protein